MDFVDFSNLLSTFCHKIHKLWLFVSAYPPFSLFSNIFVINHQQNPQSMGFFSAYPPFFHYCHIFLIIYAKNTHFFRICLVIFVKILHKIHQLWIFYSAYNTRLQNLPTPSIMDYVNPKLHQIIHKLWIWWIFHL